MSSSSTRACRSLPHPPHSQSQSRTHAWVPARFLRAVSAGLWFLSSAAAATARAAPPTSAEMLIRLCITPARAPPIALISPRPRPSASRAAPPHTTPHARTSAMGIRFEGSSRHRAQRSLGELPQSSSVRRPSRIAQQRTRRTPTQTPPLTLRAHQKSNRSVNRLHHGFVS